ncbi:MAG: O-antigen ligase family protein [Sphingomicrobium sp.]
MRLALVGLFLLAQAAMRPPVALIGFTAVPSDFIFLAVAGWAAADALRHRALPQWDPAMGWIALYGAALLLATLTATDSPRAIAKLATQAYLLAIPLTLAALLRGADDLRVALRAWLAGSALVIVVAVVGLAAFAVAADGALYRALSFYHGSLPAGTYPRLSLSFLNGNMAANYLTVSAILAILAGHLGAITPRQRNLLIAGCSLAAVTTISPGLGGLALAFGFWGWLAWRGERPMAARLALGGGIGAAILAVVASALTLVPYPGAAFVAVLPGGWPIAASIRFTIWSQALANFIAHPLLGRGLGADSVAVSFASPSGVAQALSDAHNGFLNLAVQCGIVGLAAFVALLVHVTRHSRRNAATWWLGFAFLNGIAYQGLTGSFEDARHLWAVLGLWLVARRLDRTPAA